jgi:hypothetical protein
MEISQLPETLQAAAAPVTTPLPVRAPILPIQNALPQQPDQQDQAQPDQTSTQANPIAPAPVPFSRALAPNADAASAATPPAAAQVPGHWARTLISSALKSLPSAVQGIQEALGDADTAAQQGPNYGGIAGAIGRLQNVKAARISAEEKAQSELAASNIQHMYHQMALHQMSDEHNHRDIANGQAQIEAMTTHNVELGLAPGNKILTGINENQYQQGVQNQTIDPTKTVYYPDGSYQPIDPKTGRPRIDPETGEPMLSKTYTVIEPPKDQALTDAQIDRINKFVPGTNLPHGTDGHPLIIPGIRAVTLMEQTNAAETYQAKRDLDLSKAGAEKLDADQKIASDRASNELASNQTYLKALSHFPNDLASLYSFMTGQYPEILNGKPTGKIDPQSIEAAKTNAGSNILIKYGGEKGYAAVVEKQAKDAEQQRHDRAAEAAKGQVTPEDRFKEEQENTRAAKKTEAQNNDHIDVFGNKSTLNDKEFDKRYDAFTGSNQNKTLQTLQGSYQQFGDILRDVKSGKDMTGAESVVALFNAIGISATPLAGKGFRINNSTVQEHADALGWSDKITRYGLKVKEGDVITPDQLKAYASIATDVYQHAFVNASNEQMRTMGYIDVLPRGNNQTIDPLTHAMYLQVAGGNAQKAAQAEQKSGWAVNPAAQQGGNTVQLPPAAPGTVNIQDSKGGYHNIPQGGLALARKRDPKLTVIQ